MLVPSVFNDNFFGGFPFGDDKAFRETQKKLYGNRAANVMKADVKETDKGYEVIVDLPGFKKEDIEVELNEGYLTITATKNEEEDSKGKFIRKERYVGTARRSFYIGDAVKQDDIEAGFEHGILKIDINKKNDEKTDVKKLIDIK